MQKIYITNEDDNITRVCNMNIVLLIFMNKTYVGYQNGCNTYGGPIECKNSRFDLWFLCYFCIDLKQLKLVPRMPTPHSLGIYHMSLWDLWKRWRVQRYEYFITDSVSYVKEQEK